MPYSPPPRRFGIASTPPISIHTILDVLYTGVSDTLNPPYPYSIVGFDPFSLIPFLCVMNIGIRVPSLLS